MNLTTQVRTLEMQLGPFLETVVASGLGETRSCLTRPCHSHGERQQPSPSRGKELSFADKLKMLRRAPLGMRERPH